MGAAMGQRILASGFDLTVWNRTPEKAAELVRQGAHPAATASAAVRDAEIVISMLANGPAVTEVLQTWGVAEAMAPKALFIDMSSIPPDTARRHALLLVQRGIAALDAPVSGGVVGAAAGTLAIMVGGDVDAFVRAMPVFRILGRATRVGPAGSGSLAKLANQMIVGMTIGAVAEALMLAEAGGADPAAVREAIRGGFAESKVLELHGARMLARDFTPGAHVTTQLKDLDSALHAAAQLGLDLPLTHKVHDLYQTFVRGGGAELDHSALLLALEQHNERLRNS